ncbi:M48 family metallopeptidase [Paucibacter sp. APW11]|uniref:M48 family metallopeptidase n=1 Tax=Roseateles aquae TaxID=3077235 RepID=A0ABU3PJ05_9BURK|nr:M48 family metallopeptidase [Paucibacter sp. APW11]MDT9002435.1 M48 family metallopeptidase [Paucibacter sp. APW11]
MDDARFEGMVRRLEQLSQDKPGEYQLRVALLALLGFALLALLVGFAGLGLLLLLGIAALLVFSGGKALLLLLKLGKLLILAAVPLWMLLSASFKALFVRLQAPAGRELQRDEAPELFRAIEQLRQQLKGPRFHHVLLTDELNAAVVQRPLFGLIGWPRNYLILGLPLLESLSPVEAVAVVAHEYGHLAGSHGRFGAFIYRLRLSWGTIQQLSRQWQGWAGRRLQALVDWYAPYFNAYSFVLARANEYQADRASADLVGAAVAADALKRVNLAIPRHEAFMGEQLAQIRWQATPPQDLALRWAEHSRQAPDSNAASAWLNEALSRQPQLHDTHPALAERLRALGQTDTATLPTLELAQTAAQAWLGQGLDALRSEFGCSWQAQVAEPWKARHLHLQEQQQELETLLAIAEPSQAELLKRLRLQRELQPDFDARQAFSDFTARYPDDEVGLYELALAMLGSGAAEDLETALGLLDRVMQLDPEATILICEQVHARLQARQDARAAGYARRAQERLQWEALRRAQLNTLSATEELRAAGDTPELQGFARQVLAQQGQGVAAAFFLRRVLAADPALPCYLLAVELTLWQRLRGKQQAIVERLVAPDWPAPIIVCVLEKQYKPMRKRLLKLADARLR